MVCNVGTEEEGRAFQIIGAAMQNE